MDGERETKKAGASHVAWEHWPLSNLDVNYRLSIGRWTRQLTPIRMRVLSNTGGNTMNRFRVSLSGSMLVVMFLAVALAALAYPRMLWGSIFIALLMATLCLSLVGTAFRRGDKRVFWAGYAVFGWANFLVIFPLATCNVPPQPTTLATPYLMEAIHPMRRTGPNEYAMTLDGDGQAAFYNISYSL